MIAFPAGTRVWIAGGVTDMRCGMNSLALKVQQMSRDTYFYELRRHIVLRGVAQRKRPRGAR
jgi:hypothetical protein